MPEGQDRHRQNTGGLTALGQTESAQAPIWHPFDSLVPPLVSKAFQHCCLEAELDTSNAELTLWPQPPSLFTFSRKTTLMSSTLPPTTPKLASHCFQKPL